MTDVRRVGIDLAKRVFHLTAVDGAGRVLERARLRRAGLRQYLAQLPPGTVVAMEACGSAHHWGRHALGLGCEVRLMSPHKAAPYMRRSKNDANDADGIAEAAGRPEMRFVGVKSVDRQQLQQLHRARRMAVRNRTAQANQLHGFLLEWGIESRRGIGSLLGRLPEIVADGGSELPPDGRALLAELGDELRRLDGRVKRFDDRIEAVSRADPACRRLQAIPGIGPLTATALAAAVGDPSAFRNGRELAAWLGLVPRQRSTGGRPRLLGISKRGDRYLRCLLIHGARAALRAAARRDDRRSRWAVGVEGRRGRNVATVALANKNARTAWAVLAGQADFDPGHLGKAASAGAK
ncbi:MAG: IS110 family transposase [Gammaproteobacteria bacterium]|nr:IS110 family transposase [Gammaproteobacteria bacterium]